MATQTVTSGGPSRPGVQNPYSKLPDWVYPSFVVVVLGLFTIYALWVTLLATRAGQAGPYLSPFNSPLIQVSHVPAALWIAWIPGLFRATCYYYRKAYYRSFFARPRSCAVAANGNPKYGGETIFPWVLNNFHRYAFYLTALQVVVLWWDVLVAFDFGGHFGIGLGTVIMVVNVILLSGYTFGCHAFRHLAGGGMDCLSCSKARFKLWKGVTILNVKHDRWAWTSLFSVLATDIYIRLLANNVITEPWRWVS